MTLKAKKERIITILKSWTEGILTSEDTAGLIAEITEQETEEENDS